MKLPNSYSSRNSKLNKWWNSAIRSDKWSVICEIWSMVHLFRHPLSYLHFISTSFEAIRHATFWWVVLHSIQYVQYNMSSYLEAITKGNLLTEAAWPRNVWYPLSGVLSQWWLGWPFFNVPYTNTRHLPLIVNPDIVSSPNYCLPALGNLFWSFYYLSLRVTAFI